MPAWTEEEYAKRASEVAAQSVVSKKPLNDVCEKVAKEEALNPEEIRTLVRLSNAAMFQNLFKQKDTDGASDRNVEFEVGDPEAVIHRIHQEAAAEPQTANVMNDKLAHEIPDMMGAKRRGFEYETSTTKVAQDLEVKPGKRDLVVLQMRKLADEFEHRKLAAAHRWEEKLGELVRIFNKAPGYGPSYLEFEKDAYAEHGDKVAMELGALRDELGITAPAVTADERSKLADHRIVEDTNQLKLLKMALDARNDYLSCEEGHAWVLKNTPVLGK